MNRVPCLLTLIAIVLLTSCNHVYKKYEKDSFPPSYTWAASDGIVFKPQITDVTKSYKLIFGVRHIYGFQQNAFNVTLRTVSPSGKEASKSYEIKARNDKGEYISSCAGDLCDLETVVESNLKFDEAGEYTYVVTHNLKDSRIKGIMEFGLIIDEAE